MQPTVSLILPVHNDSARLPRALKSALSQTLKEIEIIVINDSSTDNSEAVAQDFANKDFRISIVRTPKRLGDESRNYGLEAATGKYIAFLDSDDWIEPDALELLVNSCENNGADSAICATKRFIESSGKESPHYQFNDWSELTVVNETNIHKINGGLVNKLFLKCNIEQISLRFISCKLAADAEFNWRYYLHFPRISIVYKPLYIYVLRQGSLANHAQGKMSVELLVSFLSIRNHLKNAGLFKRYRNSYYLFITPRVVQRLILERKTYAQYLLETWNLLGFDYLSWCFFELNLPRMIFQKVIKRHA